MRSWIACAFATLALAAAFAPGAVAQDKVKVGVFPVEFAALLRALDRGYFKEQNIEVETVRSSAGRRPSRPHRGPDRRGRRPRRLEGMNAISRRPARPSTSR